MLRLWLGEQRFLTAGCRMSWTLFRQTCVPGSSESPNCCVRKDRRASACRTFDTLKGSSGKCA